MFNEIDIVRLTEDVRCDDDRTTLRAGMTGTVVAVFQNGAAYMVEFVNPESSIVTVLSNQIMDPNSGFRINVEIEEPTSQHWKRRILFRIWPVDDGPIIETVRTKIHAWCTDHWQGDGRDWNRDNGQILVQSEAQAVEFKMRWHGVMIDSIFGDVL